MTDTDTKPSDKSVEDFLNKIEDREDAFRILDFMKEATEEEYVMWGDIIGFGQYQYKISPCFEGDYRND